MIAYLKGSIIDISDNKIIILTKSGIGYEVIVSSIVLGKIGINKENSIFIYHHITDNTQSLFGFLDKSEKQIFEELIKISGIGGKVAIQILSIGINTLISAIKNEDKKIIESIKGIGKKMAEKIIIELKDKDFIKNSNSIDTKKENTNLTNNNLLSFKQDILSTLLNMGYQKQEIEKAILKIDTNLTNIQDIIPAIIKEL